MRKVCQAAIDLIRSHEKCVLRAYQDQGKKGGIWTIGWGHTGDVHEGDFWSQEMADSTLVDDIDFAERAVASYTRVPLNDHQFGALVDFAFNEGPQTLFESSVLEKLNQGDYEGACEALALYDKMHVGGVKIVSKDLAKRRAEEQALFRTPVLA